MKIKTMIFKQDGRNVIHIKEKGVIHVVPLEEIVYAEAQKDYMHFHLEDGREYSHLIRINILSEKLRLFKFYRSHTSYLVNHKFIREIHTRRVILEFKEKKERIPISANFKKSFKLQLFSNHGIV